jgi:O-antigen/teichoic acid export membrane protein
MVLSKQQFVKNSGWTLAELTLYPVLVILATPVFIHQLGIEQYGLWMLVVTVTQGINIFNIGIGDTVIRFISDYRAKGLNHMLSKVFRFSLFLAVSLFFLAMIVGWILSTFNFVSLFYKSTDYTVANQLILICIASWGIKFIESAILSVFKAFERFDLNSKLAIVSKNSVVIANLIMIGIGIDLLNTLYVSLIINVINIFVQLMVLRKFNAYLFGFSKIEIIKEHKHFLKYNFWYWLQSSIALIGFLTDKLAVAWFTDVKTLGYYYIASMVAANIHNFFLAFGSFIFPRVSFKLNNNADLKPLYFLSRSLIALPGWLIIGFLILGGDFIFKLWLGNETYLQSIYFIKLYLVFEAGMLLIIVPFHFINGSSQLKLNSIFEITIRISHFIFMLVGYKFLGVNGMVYGLIASTFLNIPFQYYYFNKVILHNNFNSQFILVSLPVICLLTSVLFGNLILDAVVIVFFIILCKWIYFDRAKQHSQHLSFRETN